MSLRNSGGPLMVSVVWGLAAVGILLDLLKNQRNEILQVAIYLLMGWVCVLEFSDLKNALAPAGLFWLVAGGLVYTLGIVFYALDEGQRLRHAHGIWHLFVLLGSMCHFVAVVVYVR